LKKKRFNKTFHSFFFLEIQTLIERDTLPRFLKKASFSGTLRKPRALTKSYPKVKLDEGFLNDFVEMVQVFFFLSFFLFLFPQNFSNNN